MPKYWGKQIFSHGVSPKWVKSRRRKMKRKKVGENNGQLRFVRHHGWRTQAAWKIGNHIWNSNVISLLFLRCNRSIPKRDFCNFLSPWNLFGQITKLITYQEEPTRSGLDIFKKKKKNFQILTDNSLKVAKITPQNRFPHIYEIFDITSLNETCCFLNMPSENRKKMGVKLQERKSLPGYVDS